MAPSCLALSSATCLSASFLLDTQSASEPLFTKVTFSEDMGNIYQGATVTIDIVAEAVQVKNNPGQTAVTAQGWPEIQE